MVVGIALIVLFQIIPTIKSIYALSSANETTIGYVANYQYVFRGLSKVQYRYKLGNVIYYCEDNTFHSYKENELVSIKFNKNNPRYSYINEAYFSEQPPPEVGAFAAL